MNWHIKPLSSACASTGKPFETGDRYVSFLVEDGQDREIHRYDVLEAEVSGFSPEGEVFCRWPQVYRKEPAGNEAEKQQKASLEGMFFSLFETEEEEDEDAATLKRFLGLFLQRKNILKARGVTDDGRFQVMEHRKTKSIFLVPQGEVTPEALVKIQEVLGELVGK